MCNSYADVLESYMIAEEAFDPIAEKIKKTVDEKYAQKAKANRKRNYTEAAIVGIPAFAILGYQLAKGFKEWKKMKKNSEEAEKIHQELIRELEERFDANYDNVNKKYLAMRNDIKKAMKSLNSSKVIKEIENDIKEDYKDDPELMKSLLAEVNNRMFSVDDDSALPMSSSVPKGNNDRFCASTTTNSLNLYMAPYLREVADAINLKYDTDLKLDEDYACFDWDPSTLLEK